MYTNHIYIRISIYMLTAVAREKFLCFAFLSVCICKYKHPLHRYYNVTHTHTYK